MMDFQSSAMKSSKGEDIMANIKLTIEDEYFFEAHSMGEPWWNSETPRFTYEQVLAVKKYFEDTEQGVVTYNEDTDTFSFDYFNIPDLIEESTGIKLEDGTVVYEPTTGWNWEVVA